MFLNTPGRSITEKQIIERIWKEEDKEQEKLKLYISYLKSKLEFVTAHKGKISAHNESGGFVVFAVEL